MKVLYYFNGWNSTILRPWQRNPRLRMINNFCKHYGYEFRPTAIDYKRPTYHCREILYQAEDTEEVIFSGLSLGGWFSRIMQVKLHEQNPEKLSFALAFNPSLSPGYTLLSQTGWIANFDTKKEYAWTKFDCEELSQLENSIDYGAKLPFYVFVDRGDELIPWEQSRERHKDISGFVAFSGGSHKFEHMEESLEAFEKIKKYYISQLTK